MIFFFTIGLHCSSSKFKATACFSLDYSYSRQSDRQQRFNSASSFISKSTGAPIQKASAKNARITVIFFPSAQYDDLFQQNCAVLANQIQAIVHKSIIHLLGPEKLTEILTANKCLNFIITLHPAHQRGYIFLYSTKSQ